MASYLKQGMIDLSRIYCFCAILLIGISILPEGSVAEELHVPSMYSTIQSAADAAQDGDVVLIDRGIYSGEGNKNIDLHGKSIAVRSVYGPYQCIIDLEHNGRGFYFQGESQAIIDGLTIRNGLEENGAAIFCYPNASPSLTNCILENNQATGDGGALYCFSFSSPTLTNCLIVENSAFRGGALFSSFDSSPSCVNCTFVNNSADTGGAVFCSERSDLTIKNAILWHNQPSPFYIEESHPSITFCDIQGGFPGVGNMDMEPIFIQGYWGGYYLSQVQSGEPIDSPCVNAGEEASDIICYSIHGGRICMSDMTMSSMDIPDTGIVDMGFHYLPRDYATPTPAPTMTPSPSDTPTPIDTQSPTGTATPTASPTPTIPETPTITPEPTPLYQIDLIMPSDYFAPGDPFDLILHIHNHFGLPLIDVPVLVVLNVHGHYWYYPEWSSEPGVRYVSFPNGESGFYVVGAMEWPETGSFSMSGIQFWAALLSQDFEDVIGDENGIASVSFGFGPR